MASIDPWWSEENYFAEALRCIEHSVDIEWSNVQCADIQGMVLLPYRPCMWGNAMANLKGACIGCGYFSQLRSLNQAIAAEDCGLLIFEFENGAIGLWDANRYNETNADDPRYTFGDFLVEGNGGSIRLAMNGQLSIQALGELERVHDYDHSHHGFCGDSCLATQVHFIDALEHDTPFETSGEEYLKNLVVQEAFYNSNLHGRPFDVQKEV